MQSQTDIVCFILDIERKINIFTTSIVVLVRYFVQFKGKHLTAMSVGKPGFPLLTIRSAATRRLESHTNELLWQQP